MIYAQKPIPFDMDDLGVEAMAEVGPNGHFFGTEHTQSRYKTAFYSPLLSDWSNFESWQEAGEIWTHERAYNQYQEIVNSFEAPGLDAAIDEELKAFIERREREGGAPTDF